MSDNKRVTPIPLAEWSYSPPMEPVTDARVDSFLCLMDALQVTSSSAPTIWSIHPRTYESIRFARYFPEPLRTLRKVQLRRIQARKRAWRRHVARMQVNRHA